VKTTRRLTRAASLVAVSRRPAADCTPHTERETGAAREALHAVLKRGTGCAGGRCRTLLQPVDETRALVLGSGGSA